MGCASSAAVASTPVTAMIESSEDFQCKYSLGSKIGKGAYAQVHLARKRTASAKNLVAVKIRNLHSAQSADSLDKKVCLSATKEVCLWSRIGSHRNCVQMHEHFFDAHLCYMVMEKCNEGLISHIESLSMVTEASLANIFAQMLSAIAHVHTVKVVHRDIKPDNFLVGGKDNKTVKLGDFGLSAFVPEGGKAAGVCGTAPYMCPEMLQHGEADLKADVWSLGVVAYLLLCGRFPYSCNGTAQSMKLSIANGSEPKCEKPWLTPSATSFLSAVLERNPNTRPTAKAALRMPFFTTSCKAEEDLEPMLVAAGRTGAFDAPDLNEKSTVDGFLMDLKKGKNERNSKVLAKHQIDAFIGASPKAVDKLVEDFLLPGCVDSKCRQDSESSKSTAYPSSSMASNLSGTSSR